VTADEITDWLADEMDALQARYERGDMTKAQYDAEARALLRDADEQSKRHDIIDAGRGHLIR
jgi:hypothetical protein